MYNSIKSICLLLVLGIVFSSCNNENNEYLLQVKQLEKKIDSVESVYNMIDLDELNFIYKKLTRSTEFFKANFVLFEDEDTSVTKYIYACRNLTKRMNRSFKRGGANLGETINERQKQLSNLKYDLKHNLITDTIEIARFIELEQEAVINLISSSNVIISQFNTEQEHYYQIKDSVNAIIERTKLRVY